MSTKKKKPTRRTRSRTTYECALDLATRRLEKAVEERTSALMKLDELAREIPSLENSVTALKALVEAKSPREMKAAPQLPRLDPYAPQQYTPPPPPAPMPADIDQEEFLQRFLPRTGRITSTSPPSETVPQSDGSSPDPDEFLADGGGQEILS